MPAAFNYDVHTNLASSTVATAPSPAASGLSLVVQAGEGAQFAPGASGGVNALVWPAGTRPTVANSEVVRISNRATDTLTIARHQEGSSARSIVVGDNIAIVITSKVFTDIEARLNAHGSQHQHGGGDEVATATAGANAIPKAGAGGTLDQAWLPGATESVQGASKLGRLPVLTQSGRDALALDDGEVVYVSDGIRAMVGGPSGPSPLALVGVTLSNLMWDYDEFAWLPSDTPDQNFSTWVRGANVVAGGVAPSLAAITSEANHLGIHRVATGNGTAAGLSIRWPTSMGLFLGNGRVRCGFLVRVPTISDATDRFGVIAGLVDNTAALQPDNTVNGVYLAYRDNIGTAWQTYAAAASVRTRVSSGVNVVGGTWYFLEFIINAAGTSIAFYINRTLVATTTTNIPASSVFLIPTISILKLLGTNSRTVDVDTAYLWAETTAARA